MQVKFGAMVTLVIIMGGGPIPAGGFPPPVPPFEGDEGALVETPQEFYNRF